MNEMNEKDIQTEIESLTLAIKENQQKLNNAKAELRRLRKFQGLHFDLYKDYRKSEYWNALSNDTFIDSLRKLVGSMAGTKIGYNDHGAGYLHTTIKPVKEMRPTELKLCNDFLDELYPLVEKYMDMFLGVNDNE